MIKRQWIAINPHPRTIMFKCANHNCPWRNFSMLCDDDDKHVTCPRCGTYFSLAMTTEKRLEMKEQRRLFVELMDRVQKECPDFVLYS